MLCLRLFKKYHFQTWQVYPLKTLLTKQKIRKKQLAFSGYFKQRNRHYSEIRRFFGGGQVCFHQPQTTNTHPPSPRPNLLLPPPPPPLWTIITKQKTRQKQLARFPVISNSQTVVIWIFNFKKREKTTYIYTDSPEMVIRVDIRICHYTALNSFNVFRLKYKGKKLGGLI